MSRECVCACTEWCPQESSGSSGGGGRRYNNKQRFIKSVKTDEEEKDHPVQSPSGSSTSPTQNRARAAKARGSPTPLAAANDSNNKREWGGWRLNNRAVAAVLMSAGITVAARMGTVQMRKVVSK